MLCNVERAEKICCIASVDEIAEEEAVMEMYKAALGMA
jgi:hypothetical protein